MLQVAARTLFKKVIKILNIVKDRSKTEHLVEIISASFYVMQYKNFKIFVLNIPRREMSDLRKVRDNNV